MTRENRLVFKKEVVFGVNPLNAGVPLNTKHVEPPTLGHNAQPTYSVDIKFGDGSRIVAPRCKIVALTMPSKERFIVCLIESGNIAPSTNPKQHKSRESAEKEAERLCKLYHKEFAVMQVVSAIKPQEPKKEVFV